MEKKGESKKKEFRLELGKCHNFPAETSTHLCTEQEFAADTKEEGLAQCGWDEHFEIPLHFIRITGRTGGRCRETSRIYWQLISQL